MAVRAEATVIPSGFSKVRCAARRLIAAEAPPGSALGAGHPDVQLLGLWAAVLASSSGGGGCGSRPLSAPRLLRLLLQVEPKGDRVLVKVAEQEEKTRGGILLPVSAQKRPTSGAAAAPPRAAAVAAVADMRWHVHAAAA